MLWFKRKMNSNASQIAAAIVGAFLTTIALTIAITLSWPFGDKVEQIFAGGLFFFVFWATLFYWALLADGGLKAWTRIGSLLLTFGIYDVLSLTVFA
ncbi:MAG: hypothetical protein MK185_05445 [Saccharospirillaceae bacterium]|jgi:hypothetical protein|nr:hypothetical protein A3759_15670 [Thalassolituus sp. HI0120]MCH2040057.1 hypothetical protein [Saccharospirillaceae bacterium]